MAKHILDRPRTRKGQMLRRFAGLDASLRGLPRRQTHLLRRTPKTRDGALRLRRYLYLDRHSI